MHLLRPIQGSLHLQLQSSFFTTPPHAFSCSGLDFKKHPVLRREPVLNSNGDDSFPSSYWISKKMLVRTCRVLSLLKINEEVIELDHQEYSVTVTEIEIDPMIWISDSVRLCYLLFIYIVRYRSWTTTTYAVTSLWEAFVENTFPCRPPTAVPNMFVDIDLLLSHHW